jgi:hypothetical protein
MPEAKEFCAARQPEEREQATHGHPVSHAQGKRAMQAREERRPGFELFDSLRLEIETTLIAGQPPGIALRIAPALQHETADRPRNDRTPEPGYRQMPDRLVALASQPKAIFRTWVPQKAKILQGVRSSHTQMIIGGGHSNHRDSVTA